MLAAVRIAGKLFAAVFQPADGITKMSGKKRRTHFLRQQHAFVTEAAANIRRNDAEILFRDAETAREPGPDDVRNLRRGMQNNLIEAFVVDSHDTAALKRRHALTRGPQGPPNNHRRGFLDFGK